MIIANLLQQLVLSCLLEKKLLNVYVDTFSRCIDHPFLREWHIYFLEDVLLSISLSLDNSSPSDKPISQARTTNFRLFQTDEFADDNFKFDENGRKFPKRVEITVGKGEIAHYEQFLLFSVFSKGLVCRHIKTRACLGKG